MSKAVLLAALVACATPVGASAYDRLVNPEGTCPAANGGGAPQHATIQEAVTAAAPGDAIGICPGTYLELVTVPATKTGISLTGLGWVSVRPAADDFGGLRVLADGVRIERLRLRGFEAPGLTVIANHATIEHNDVSSTIEAMTISGDGHRVRNNVIHLVGEYALIALEINGADISGNRVSGGNVGILAWGVDKASPGTVIHHNLVTGGGGIVLGDAAGGTIRNNTVRSTIDGITVSGTTGVAILRNVVQMSFGIWVSDSTSCTVAYNSVSFNDPGIALTKVDGCTIERNNAFRNTVPDCSWDGFGANTFSANACATEEPAGAWD